jgi:hypothetical protein
MTGFGSGNKIINYLLSTALMMIAFVCGIAVSTASYSTIAWGVLLALNLAVLVYLLRK